MSSDSLTSIQKNSSSISSSSIQMADQGGQGATYTLDQAFSAIGLGKFQLYLLAYAGLGSIAEAMEMMLLSFIGLAIQPEMNLTSSQVNLISVVSYAGLLLGSYLFGIISDRYGRRIGIIGTSVVAIVAGISSMFIHNYTCWLLVRCIFGVGLGGGHIFSSWFMEFVPTPNRGMWMIGFFAFSSAGTIIQSLCVWLILPNYDWRWLLGVAIAPHAVAFVFVWRMPESVRFLCEHGRVFEAQSVLRSGAALNKKNLPEGTLVYDGISSSVRIDQPMRTPEPLDKSNESHVEQVLGDSLLQINSSSGTDQPVPPERDSSERDSSDESLIERVVGTHVPLDRSNSLVERAVSTPVGLERLDEPFVERVDESLVERVVGTRDESFVERVDESLVERVDESLVERVDESLVERVDESLVERVVGTLVPLKRAYEYLVERVVGGLGDSTVNTPLLAENSAENSANPNQESDDLEDNSNSDAPSSIFGILSPRWRLITILISWIYFSTTFSYYGILVLTSSPGSLICSLTIKNSQPLLNVLVISVAELPGLVIAALMLRKFGLKLSMKILFGGGFLILLPMVFFESRLLTMIFAFLGRMLISSGFVLAQVYTTEAYPTQLRATGVGVAMAWGNVGGTVWPLVASVIRDSGHKTIPLILFEAKILLSALCVWFLPVEITEEKFLLPVQRDPPPD